MYAAVPRNKRATITLLASLLHQGMREAFILEGSADTTVFELSTEQILAPSLQAGQIVILDNLNTHTGERVRQAIEARECQFLFLPSYSPDVSPIEEAFSKLKAFLRHAQTRTAECRLWVHALVESEGVKAGYVAHVLGCLEPDRQEWFLLAYCYLNGINENNG